MSEEKKAVIDEKQEEIKAEDVTKEATQDKKESELKYSDADVDEIVKKKQAKWQKQQEEKIKELEEAQKLEKMNEEDQLKYKLEKYEKELEAYKQRENQNAMAKVAKNMLFEEGIKVSDGLVANLITDEAESTKENVKDFAKEFKEAVEKGITEALRGKSPEVKTSGTKSASATKAEILGIKDSVKRQSAIAENLELFE